MREIAVVVSNDNACNIYKTLDGPITMELCYRNRYEEISVEDFYKKGYELGLKLSELFDK